MDRTPLTDDDVQSFGVSSLALARARRFLEALQENDFLCLVVNDRNEVTMFSKGDEDTIAALMKL